MLLTDSQQTTAFLWAFVSGIIIAVFYTFMISVRSSFDAPLYIVVITDFLFSFSVCIAEFIYAIAFTDSAVRLYVIAAQLVSFSVFYLLIGKYIKLLTIIIIRKLTEILLFIQQGTLSLVKSIFKIK